MQQIRFETRDAASLAAAEHIVAALAKRLDAQDEASLIVSGGSTPARCFAELAQADLSWPDVHIVPSDERWVPPDHEDSNEKLIRETLLTGAAADASFFGMYAEGETIGERAAAISTELRTIPFPFACALIGMGADGHFASLFPDADNLDAALDPEFGALCVPVQTAASPHPRLSLTLAAISRSDEVVLLIFGNDKWHTLQAASESADVFPVSQLLKQKRAPVNVFWAP